MSENRDFYSFEEALDQLRLKEEELKRLVSEGEIRAFREGDTMKLRRADVEHLQSELMGGEVVELGDTGTELVFEDDFEDPGMATEELSAADTLLDDELGDLDELEDLDRETVAVDRDDEFTVAPVGRKQEAVREDPLALGAALVTLVLLLLAGPVLISASTGNLSDMASSIAGLFGHEFGQ